MQRNRTLERESNPYRHSEAGGGRGDLGARCRCWALLARQSCWTLLVLGLFTEARESGPGKPRLLAAQVVHGPRKVDGEG